MSGGAAQGIVTVHAGKMPKTSQIHFLPHDASSRLFKTPADRLDQCMRRFKAGFIGHTFATFSDPVAHAHNQRNGQTFSHFMYNIFLGRDGDNE